MNIKRRSKPAPEKNPQGKSGDIVIPVRLDKIELARKRLAQGFYNTATIKELLSAKLLADPDFLKAR
ncbi:MAG: hypothetical protein L0Y74_01605 [candidate division Zixibacteria bacterium]|nr:hypothetical protein [candidate division Zixibacteria bacterium]